jgi:aspartyl-tRNA(Asn)/glutamyl-tRNA(Gln) amidotransferase subunit C
MSKISRQQVEHIAKLAELEFSAGELDTFTGQLDKILSHVAKIGTADTAGLKPMSHTLILKNVFREDTAKDSLSNEDALKNAPKSSGDGFLVPKID